MLEVFLLLFNLCVHINEVAHRNGKLVGANHEGRCIGGLLLSNGDGLEIAHLADDAIVVSIMVVADGLQLQFLLGSNILVVADGAHACNDLLDRLYTGNETTVGVGRRINMQLRHHDALVGLALIDVLPQFFGDERHEGMKHLHQPLEET